MFKNRFGQLRSGWKIAIMMGIAIIAMILCVAVFGIIISIIAMPKATVDGVLDTGKLKDEIIALQNSQLFTIITMAVQEIIFILTPVIIWKFFFKRPLSNMGLTSLKKGAKELLVGLLFGIVSFSFVFVLLIFTGNAKVESWTPQFNINQLIFIPIFIAVGFAEEIFTRGYIMSTLRQTRNLPVIVLVSSAIFALMHGGNKGVSILAFVNLALVGILFAFMYLKSGNIWMCIGYHITWNYFQGYVYGFKVSGTDSSGIITTITKTNNFWNGGAFGPEGGLFVTIIIILGIFFVINYYHNSKFDFIASEIAIQENGDIPEVTEE
jgi:Predicted metal-dependent membrane protease